MAHIFAPGVWSVFLCKMEYTQKYNELKALFRPEQRENIISGSGTRIVNTDFKSDFSGEAFYNKSDLEIIENTSFSYPVFIPDDTRSKKVILLLHGLNERSWIKYLAWAWYLSKMTESYVILFPISFHINRSPESWRDPRAMLGFMNERKTVYGNIRMASIANIALSSRLTEDPLRFFNSGYQTACDIVKLLLLIKAGKHDIIPGGSRVNVFSYSIGAFLSQILFMGNPQNLFSESKLFMFCGGSVFSNMHGTSKLIMDDIAFNKVYKYYMSEFEGENKERSPFLEFVKWSRLGMAFRSMIDLGRFLRFRENSMKDLKDRIRAIALTRDTVIPAKGIVETLRGQKVEVIDFPYTYSHENPFPVNDIKLSPLVDSCFERVFTPAASFLV